MSYLSIIIGFIFVENIVLARFLGLCPFFGVSGDSKRALAFGISVTFIMSIASLIAWLLYHLVLLPLNIEFLKLITFLLVILLAVRLLELILKKISSPLHSVMGTYFPLLSHNCLILGIALIIIRKELNAVESFIAGFAAGTGFLLVILFMSAIREHVRRECVPKVLQGAPIALLSGALMAMAFLAFDSVLLNNLFG